MSKKTETKTPQKKSAVPKNENEGALNARLKDIRKILELNEKGLDTFAVASKVKLGATYVAEVIKKGVDEMEEELREQYQLPPKETNDEATHGESESTGENIESSASTETKKDIAAREKAEKKALKDTAKPKKDTAKEVPKEKANRGKRPAQST